MFSRESQLHRPCPGRTGVTAVGRPSIQPQWLETPCCRHLAHLLPQKNLLLFKPSKIENQRLIKVQVSNMPASKCGGILGISASGTAPSKLAAIRWSYGSRPAWYSPGSQTPGTRSRPGCRRRVHFAAGQTWREEAPAVPRAQTPKPDPAPTSDPGLPGAQTQTPTEFQTPTQAWTLTPDPTPGLRPRPLAHPWSPKLQPNPDPPPNSSDPLNSRRPTPGPGLQPRPRPTRTPVRPPARLAAP